jgi:hypothetical protein
MSVLRTTIWPTNRAILERVSRDGDVVAIDEQQAMIASRYRERAIVDRAKSRVCAYSTIAAGLISSRQKQTIKNINFLVMEEQLGQCFFVEV